jgi:hypothetical protein
MKAKKLAGELCWTRDFDEAWTAVMGAIRAITPASSRSTSRSAL